MGVNVRVSGEVECPECHTMVNLNPPSKSSSSSKKKSSNMWTIVKCVIVAVVFAIVISQVL